MQWSGFLHYATSDKKKKSEVVMEWLISRESYELIDNVFPLHGHPEGNLCVLN